MDRPGHRIVVQTKGFTVTAVTRASVNKSEKITEINLENNLCFQFLDKKADKIEVLS